MANAPKKVPVPAKTPVTPVTGVVPGVWSKTAPPSAKSSEIHNDHGPSYGGIPAAAKVAATGKVQVDPESFYAITLSKFAEAANVKFRPMHRYVVKGKIVTALGDAVKSVEASDQLH